MTKKNTLHPIADAKEENKKDSSQELRNALMEVKESMEGKKKLMTWKELVNEMDD